MLDPDALTIGFARRFTAYKRPELIFHDPERLARILDRRQPAGADRVRRQGASGRRSGEASPAAGVPPRARSDVCRTRRLHRRLRPARRALPGRRLRRVAEQPAQAARSERHERHEGVAQRRAAPERRRRLVGRGLQRPERLADREPDQPRRSRRHRRGRRRVALSAARGAGRAGVLRARRRRTCRAAGSRSCARRCDRTCRASRRAGC